MLPSSLNKSNRLSNHITDTFLHFRDPTDHQSLTGKRKEGEEGGSCSSVMDLLTKTGPISGAVWARGMECLQLDADGFSSLQAVRNKAGVSSISSTHIERCSINTSWDEEQKKKKRKRTVIWRRQFLLVSSFGCINKSTKLDLQNSSVNFSKLMTAHHFWQCAKCLCVWSSYWGRRTFSLGHMTKKRQGTIGHMIVASHHSRFYRPKKKKTVQRPILLKRLILSRQKRGDWWERWQRREAKKTEWLCVCNEGMEGDMA